jgi:hypothetical protein
MDSLLAISIFLLSFIKANVGSSPAIPGIAETDMSIFLIYFCIFVILFRIIIFFNFFIFFTLR